MGGRGGNDRLRVLGLLAALVCAVVAAWPLLTTPGLLNTRAGGDSPFLLLRVYELQSSLRAGVFPVRWMPDAAFGLGYPFFNYYAALPYYLAASLSLAGAGILWAIKWTQFLGFLGAAAAFYALADELLDDPLAALLGAAAYTFAPFHLVNVYVRGDSLSEFYAFVFYPLILWAIVRLRRKPSAGAVVLLALGYGALMVTHNVSVLIFTPLAVLAFFLAVATAPRHRLKVLLGGSVAFVLGAILSAWFWLPALRERGLVSLQVMTTGYFSYTLHFRGRDLVQPSFLFDYRLDGQHSPFALGAVQAALGLMGTLLALSSRIWQRRPHWADLGLLPLLGYAIWPITPFSSVAWEHLPLLAMAQFPWRFLSIAALAIASATSAGLSRLGRLRWLALPLVVIVAVSGLAQLPVESLPLSEADITPERLQLYEQFTGNIGSTVRAEYLPAGVAPVPRTSAALLSGQAHPAPLLVEGAASGVHLVESTPILQTWDLEVTTAQARAVFQTLAFAGWMAKVDGQPTTYDTDANGRIALSLTKGRHRVTLCFVSTSGRRLVERIALGGACLIAVLAAIALWEARQHWRGWLVALGMVVAIAVGALLPGALAQSPSPASLATETMDYVTMPYLHPNPQGVVFGGKVRLVGYELSREAQAGETLLLRLHWQTPCSEGVEVIARLTSTAEVRAPVPSFATSRTPLAAVTEHRLEVSPEVAPGLALVAIEVQDAEGTPLTPRSSNGTILGTTYLAPVRIAPMAPAPDLVAQAQMGEWLDVLGSRVEESKAGLLQVHVTWRARRNLPEDYLTAVRLYAPDGQQVPETGADEQPRYGLYPTSLWLPGCPVADYYLLRVARGTPPGKDYQIEITLYRARSLEPIGSIRIPNVTISQPTIDAHASVVFAFDQVALTQWRPQRLEIEDGEEFVADVQWTAQSTPAPEAFVCLSLVDEQGKAVATSEAPISPVYPPNHWPLHALVNDRLRLRVPPGMQPGSYHLAIEVVTATGQSLGRWDNAQQILVRAASRNRSLPTFAHAVGVDFSGLIRLAGYDLERSATQIALTFHWQALQAPGKDYKVFLHLFDPETEEIVAQSDAMPLGNTYPTGRWAEGEVVSDRLVLAMADVPPGRYRLGVGWYEPLTEERLEPTGGTAAISNRRVLLDEIIWP